MQITFSQKIARACKFAFDAFVYICRLNWFDSSQHTKNYKVRFSSFWLAKFFCVQNDLPV